MDARLHGAQRDAGQLRDLGVVVALDVEQDDRVPLVRRDRREGGRKHARSLAVHRRPDRVVLGPRGRLPALVLELGVWLRRPTLLEPLLVHRGVDRDAAQPRAHAATAERAHVAVGGEERLLDGVGRLVPVGHHARDEREQMVLVALDEAVERLEAAIACLLEEHEVAALDRVVDGLGRADVLHDGRGPPGGDRKARRV